MMIFQRKTTGTPLTMSAAHWCRVDFVSLLDVDHRHDVAYATICLRFVGASRASNYELFILLHHRFPARVPSSLSSLFSFSFGTRSQVLIPVLFLFVPSYFRANPSLFPVHVSPSAIVDTVLCITKLVEGVLVARSLISHCSHFWLLEHN
ncbi:hypothetical protein BDR03DRAFT_947793 [Suillus americanus]|nr:hypothetical protein BDR03DRAFT_947793 [Suillus americanus]